MADETDMEKLAEQIKALKKQSEALDAEVDEAHKAGQAVKAEATSSSKELGKIKERK